jgi:Na+/H+ antiporter NhaD/arsenite permease-like protein
MSGSGNPAQAAVAFAFVAGYALILRAFQSRSDLASVLSGLSADERWTSINVRALSVAAQVLAVVIVVGFLVSQFQGGDTDTYARLGAIFAAAYVGGLFWYRSRS